jgi:hypothetical protein
MFFTNIRCITTICIHAPAEEKDEMQRDAFYEILERMYMTVPEHDIKIVMGDFSAKRFMQHP